MKANRQIIQGIGLFMLIGLSGCGGGGGGGGGGGSSADLSSDIVPASTSKVVLEENIFPYEVTVLKELGEQSYALALNDSGQIVGNYLDAGGRLHACLWQNSSVKTIAENAQVADINDNGQAVGWIEESEQSQAYFYDSDGVLYDLPAMDGASRALAVNNLGQTAGRISGDSEHAFVEDYGSIEMIAPGVNGYAVGLNDAGDVLIKNVANETIRSLLWTAGELVDLGTLGGEMTQAEDINQTGQIVGWSQTAGGATHPFLWENGIMIDLGNLAGDFSSAVAINDNGQILLKSSSSQGDRTLLYEDGQVTDLGNFGAEYAVVTDINNFGEIVGWLETGAGEMRAFVAKPL